MRKQLGKRRGIKTNLPDKAESSTTPWNPDNGEEKKDR